MFDLCYAAAQTTSNRLLNLARPKTLSCSLSMMLRCGIECRRCSLTDLFPQRLLDKPARLPTHVAGEPFGLHLASTFGVDDDFDTFQVAPPTLTVSLIAPLSSRCSTTE